MPERILLILKRYLSHEIWHDSCIYWCKAGMKKADGFGFAVAMHAKLQYPHSPRSD
jgi:hypothetical protein